MFVVDGVMQSGVLLFRGTDALIPSRNTVATVVSNSTDFPLSQRRAIFPLLHLLHALRATTPVRSLSTSRQLLVSRRDCWDVGTSVHRYWDRETALAGVGVRDRGSYVPFRSIQQVKRRALQLS